MAKTGVLEDNPTMTTAKATELKKDLQRLVKAIVEEDDYSDDTADQALKTLYALKGLKFKQSVSFGLHNHAIPDKFRCPISKELMRDPVVLSSGQTYDRPFIQKWLKDGNRTCPQTHQVLSHVFLTPNHLVRELISHWCEEHGIELPDPIQNQEVITVADQGYLNSLLGMMSSSLPEQKEAAKKLRQLTKRMPSFRTLFGESIDTIPQLLYPLLPGRDNTDPELQEDLITTVLNLSIHDNNKKLVAENPLVIPLLIESLKTGTIETRTNAAAALFTLSALDSNKHIIGKSGAIKPLIDLLEEGNLFAMKDVASAIYNLCIILENKGRAVRDGAVRVIMKKIMDRILVDELLVILAVLSGHQKAAEEMLDLGAVPCLLSIIREGTNERSKENCIAILYSICINDRAKMREIREEEDANGTISKLAERGTSRARRKAKGILEGLNRATSITHTA
ncbi:hypothetical protein L1049_021230 [Liquidambar formosana]|uniref:RING-type E3 ubiquitin transferase n=1 Tax=Liquidambar formosana TaxID=63359 RepID=A0AAP0SEZ3_LIQFO